MPYQRNFRNVHTYHNAFIYSGLCPQHQEALEKPFKILPYFWNNILSQKDFVFVLFFKIT